MALAQAYNPGSLQIVPGADGMYSAVNPRTGQLEPVFNDNDTSYMYFPSDGTVPSTAARAGTPQYFSHDWGSPLDNFMGNYGVPLSLAAIGGAAALGEGGFAAGAAAPAAGGAGGAAEAVPAAAGGTAAPAVASGGALGSGLSAGASGASGITPGVVSATGDGLGAGITSPLAGNVATGSLGALSNDALAVGGLSTLGGAAAGGLAGTAAATAAGAAGATGAGTAGAAAGAGGIGATKLGDVLNGNVSLSDLGSALTLGDLAKFGGALAPGVLGYLGAKQQTDAFSNLAQKYMDMGAPYRAQLADLYANPSSFLSSPAVTAPNDQATSAMARALSVNGNPTGDPSVLAEIQKYSANNLASTLGQEKDRLAGAGGLTAYNQAAPSAASSAIGAQGGQWNALGYGLNAALNPQPTLAQLFQQYSQPKQASAT